VDSESLGPHHATQPVGGDVLRKFCSRTIICNLLCTKPGYLSQSRLVSSPLRDSHAMQIILVQKKPTLPDKHLQSCPVVLMLVTYCHGNADMDEDISVCITRPLHNVFFLGLFLHEFSAFTFHSNLFSQSPSSIQLHVHPLLGEHSVARSRNMRRGCVFRVRGGHHSG
jgi:hypothetical protein